MKRIRGIAVFLIILILALLAVSPACDLIKHDDQSANNGTEAPTVTGDPSAEATADATGDVDPDGSGIPWVTEGDQTNTPAAPTGEATPAPTDASGSTPEPGGNTTAAPTQTTPTQAAGTSIPVQTPAPTLPPDATPTPKPDPVTTLTWFDDSAPVYCDLDFDGKAERVELKLTPAGSNTYNCTLIVALGTSGKELKESFTAEYFTKALINNFNTGDNRVEIVISTGTGARGQMIRAYRLNSASNALINCQLDGWIETVSGNTVQVGRYIDVLGTWGCTAEFGFANTGFAFIQQGSEWQVHRDSERWCTASTTLLFELLLDSTSENYASFLYRGDKIYPVATDARTFIRFVTDIGDKGVFTITADSSGRLYISGKSVDDCFSDLSYIN